MTSLVSELPFYIAHRGGGGDWPEMTGYAYEQSAALPQLKALEISACITADGVLVCSHDPTTTRVTGVPYTIAKETWGTLSNLKVSPKATVDPSQPARPFTRFIEVVERYIDNFVLFVEPKVDAAVEPLLKHMVALGQPERVVWKQWITSPHFATAKEQRFSTLAYVLDQPSHLGKNLLRIAQRPEIDMLAAPREKPDRFASNVVAAANEHGKNTIMWNIRTEEDRRRALRLGCRGLMTSHVREVLAARLR